MLVKERKGWELPESAATPEHVYLSRKSLVQGLAAAPVLLASASAMPGLTRTAAEDGPIAPELYPAERNERYVLDRPLTDEELATTHNNIYEFGFHKQISKAAQDLRLRPWIVTLDRRVDGGH